MPLVILETVQSFPNFWSNTLFVVGILPKIADFASGGTSEQIKVYSNASTYSVSLLPSWCTVQTYNGYFIVTCNANTTSQPRSDWFRVTAGGKEVKVYISQVGKNYKSALKTSSCFNCPKGDISAWGLTLGYAPKSLNNSLMDCVQFGLKAEPLFKYGFGLNTGLIIEGYSQNMFNNQLFQNGFDYYALNIPLHLEYRLNFHKWFNMFFYSGVGFNAVTDSDFEEYNLPVTLEYGGSFRISHVQFSVGRKNYLGDFLYIEDFGQKISPCMDWNFSISIML